MPAAAAAATALRPQAERQAPQTTQAPQSVPESQAAQTLQSALPAQARPALTLTKRRSAAPASEDATIQRQAEGGALPVTSYGPAAAGGPGMEIIQRQADAGSANAGPSYSAGPGENEHGKAGTPQGGQDINLLAHEVWSLLKMRLGHEAERMGRR